MATTHSQTISDTVAFAGRSLTRWPVYVGAADAVDGVTYGGKENLIIDLLRCPPSPRIADIIQRLSNTDTSTWTDVGSRVI